MFRSRFKLCYVGGSFAYFTTQDLKNQWGDDWDDAPYDCNAGGPYEPSEADLDQYGSPKWRILKFAFDGNFSAPANSACSSHYRELGRHLSVQDVNIEKAAPWLEGHNKKGDKIEIHAGASIEEFREAIKAGGGVVYGGGAR